MSLFFYDTCWGGDAACSVFCVGRAAAQGKVFKQLFKEKGCVGGNWVWTTRVLWAACSLKFMKSSAVSSLDLT